MPKSYTERQNMRFSLLQSAKSTINAILHKTGHKILKVSTVEKLNSELSNLKNDIIAATHRSEDSKGQLEDLDCDDISIKAQSRYDKIIFHVPVKGVPEVRLAQTIPHKNTQRVILAERIITAYHKATAGEKSTSFAKPSEDLWSELVATELRVLLDILDTKNAKQLADYLMDFGKEYNWFGGLTFSLDGYNQNRTPEHIAFSYFDKLVSCAEALGVLPSELPEHGRWGENIYCGIDDLVKKIENELKIDITPPQNVVSVYGILSTKGVFNYRHINGLYAAYKVKSLMSDFNKPICEYGAGLGTVAYYLMKMGTKNYTIFDLPIINVFAAHFLLNCLSPDSVVLYGEDTKAEAVKIYPYWLCEEVPDKYFNLSLNQDSFPEIDQNIVIKYLEEIARTTNKYFLSINHEAQSPMAAGVNDNVQLNISKMLRSYPRFKRVYRSRYWIREGYIEELYNLQS